MSDEPKSRIITPGAAPQSNKEYLDLAGVPLPDNVVPLRQFANGEPMPPTLSAEELEKRRKQAKIITETVAARLEHDAVNLELTAKTQEGIPILQWHGFVDMARSLRLTVGWLRYPDQLGAHPPAPTEPKPN